MFAINKTDYVSVIPNAKLSTNYIITFDDYSYIDLYSSLYYFLNIDYEEFENIIIHNFHGEILSDEVSINFNCLQDAEQALEWLEAQYIASKLTGWEPEEKEEWEEWENWEDWYDDEEEDEDEEEGDEKIEK